MHVTLILTVNNYFYCKINFEFYLIQLPFSYSFKELVFSCCFVVLSQFFSLEKSIIEFRDAATWFTFCQRKWNKWKQVGHRENSFSFQPRWKDITRTQTGSEGTKQNLKHNLMLGTSDQSIYSQHTKSPVFKLFLSPKNHWKMHEPKIFIARKRLIIFFLK